MFYHIEQILADADYRSIIEHLQIEHSERNGKLFIRCPEHIKRTGKSERVIDNCIMSQKGYHCFSCGASGNLIKLVETVQNVNFTDAISLILEVSGLDPEDYSDSDGHYREQNPMYIFPLKEEELKLLNLESYCRVRLPKNICMEKTDAKNTLPYWLEDGYVVGDSFSYSLYQFWVENSEEFWEMILGKIKEAQVNTAAVLQSRILENVFSSSYIAYQTSLALVENLNQINKMAAKYGLPMVSVNVTIRRKSRFHIKKNLHQQRVV